jgi:hypothetical protein
MALQRWNKITTPVVGVDSVVTYTFPAIGQGFAAMVSVSVPGSDAVNQWDVLVSGSLITSVSGSQVVGPVWLANGDVITIVGTPLFGAGPAVAVGVVGLPNEIPPTSMAPSPGGQLTTISPVVETYAGPSATVQVPVGATGILILSSVPVLSVIGVNGATNYPVSLYSPGQPLGGCRSKGLEAPLSSHRTGGRAWGARSEEGRLTGHVTPFVGPTSKLSRYLRWPRGRGSAE